MFLRNQKGLMMITAYMIIAALSVFAAAAIKMATTEYNFSKRYFAKVKARYLAEAVADDVAYDLAEKIATGEAEPVYDPDVDEGPVQWTDLCGTINDYISTGYNVDYECVVLDADHQSATSPARERHYQVSATATDPDTGVSATINDIIIRRKTYVFQHAIFYDKDLEVLPGSNMTLSGNVHSNKDIYLSTGATLRIDADYLESAGNIYNRRKDNTSTGGGDVEILKRDTASFVDMWLRGEEAAPLDCRRGDWGSASQTRWKGTVKSGVHGITSKAIAEVYSIQSDGYYADQAGVKVVNDDVYVGATVLVEASYTDHNNDGTIDADDFGPNDIPVGTADTSTGFYNYREGKYIKMTDIDLRKLAGWVQGVDGDGNPLVDGGGNPIYVQHYSNHLPSNGLMYAMRDDIVGSEEPGVRIYNGSKIYNSTGLTLVTDAPAYIQGDFNSVDKTSAAVISDALNIVSNNWSDANSDGTLSARTAVDTTVNAAFISGVDETVGSTYSGGLENYPRLHENWSGQTLTIRGSFVQLWECQVAGGAWGNSSYNAPVRNWDYDSDFSDVGNLPAFTPQVVGLERLAHWEGDSDQYPDIFESPPE
jgi:hypothetical protein